MDVHLLSQIPHKIYNPKEVYKAIYLRPYFYGSNMINEFSVEKTLHREFMRFTNTLFSNLAEKIIMFMFMTFKKTYVKMGSV